MSQPSSVDSTNDPNNPPVQYVQAIALVNNQDPQKINVTLMVDLALFQCVQEGQKAAIAQNDAMEVANQLSQALIEQLGDQKFQDLPAGTSNSDQNTIVNVNIANQRVQANVSLIQDQLNIGQQVSQTATQQASSTIQNTSQTQSEFSAVTQIMIEITQDITN
ncbi:MAG: hypothetical protein JSS62_02405 [Verrucomicrobia bacterium]|nr:hypothetical protein [Verrucomicrobiota bacterium]MBS0646901.1 hypothetical protein [Verrucomicrobiota bacterium]